MWDSTVAVLTSPAQSEADQLHEKVGSLDVCREAVMLRCIYCQLWLDAFGTACITLWELTMPCACQQECVNHAQMVSEKVRQSLTKSLQLGAMLFSSIYTLSELLHRSLNDFCILRRITLRCICHFANRQLAI